LEGPLGLTDKESKPWIYGFRRLEMNLFPDKAMGLVGKGEILNKLMKNIIETVRSAMPTLVKRGIALGFTMILLNVSLAVAEPTTGIEGALALQNDAAVAAADDFGGDFPRRKVSVSMYNAVPGQTDDTPCITANGDNICDPNIGLTAAMNGVPFGTRIMIPALDNAVYTVNDRMNRRYDSTYMDIHVESYTDAIRFGRKNLEIVILN
jgi:3D (Asp-Asp-Asp) domain-containing protein